jgi:hypothetical protein
LRDERVAAVGADHDFRALHRVAAPDSGDHAVLEHEFVHREAGANFGSGLRGRFEEQRVENRATRSVALGNAVARQR